MTEVVRVPEVAGGPGSAPGTPPAPVESYPFHLDLAPLREIVRARARGAGLPPHRVVDLVLAVGEATANTVRHAGGAGTLRIWQDETEIVCEVSDGGSHEEPARGAAAAGRGHPGRSGSVDHPPGLRPGRGDVRGHRHGAPDAHAAARLTRPAPERTGPLATSHAAEEPGTGSLVKY